MAKRKSGRRGDSSRRAKKLASAGRRSVKRRSASKPARRAASRRSRGKGRTVRKPAVQARSRTKPAARKSRPAAPVPGQGKRPRLDRERRTLDDTVPTPPSSLNMDRHGSAARSGREALQVSLEEHNGMTPELTGGDV